MNKTAQIELHRHFLIEQLPEPLTPASSHLQLFDNYIDNTRMRIRQVRDPSTKNWIRIIQQIVRSGEEMPGISHVSEIHLSDEEFATFEQFLGREIRKNRYFHEFDGAVFTLDIYMGKLWGLNTASIEFDSNETMEAFVPPPFAIFEVTAAPFFHGESLVDRNFAEIQTEVARLGLTAPPSDETPDS